MYGWICQKYRNKAGMKENTRLPYYGKMMEKKDKKTILHLLHIIVSGNRHRVLFLSFFSTIFFVVG